MMIIDACVLIDFIKADRTVLELVVNHVGPLHVLSPIIAEVKEIDENELADLGLTVIEWDIEDASNAGERSRALSFNDWLCLLTAKRHSFTCVTNDISLRKECNAQDVSLMWGFNLLAELHNIGGIFAKEAEKIAQEIRKSNPKHITEKIISDFLDIIRKQEGRRSRP